MSIQQQQEAVKVALMGLGRDAESLLNVEITIDPATGGVTLDTQFVYVPRDIHGGEHFVGRVSLSPVGEPPSESRIVDGLDGGSGVSDMLYVFGRDRVIVAVLVSYPDYCDDESDGEIIDAWVLPDAAAVEAIVNEQIATIEADVARRVQCMRDGVASIATALRS